MRALYHAVRYFASPGLRRASMTYMSMLALLLAGLLHHSFAMFDTTRTVTLVGTVTAFEWTNPHAYIELDVPGDGGATSHWTIELGSPSILQQGGWKFKDLKFGDKITAIVNPLKSGQPGALLSRITMPDGRVLGNGPGAAGRQ